MHILLFLLAIGLCSHLHLCHHVGRRQRQRDEAHLYSEQYAEELELVQRTLVASQIGSAISNIAAISLLDDTSSKRRGRPVGSINVKRQRLDVEAHLNAMDHRLFRRKYRMGKELFFKLYDIVAPFMSSTGERDGGGVPNGPITTMLRLSMTLRFSAGGDTTDIAHHHGVHVGEVNNSLKCVVGAIHMAPELKIVFPETEQEQQELADGFKAKSEIGIPMCVRATDGILIWIHKQSATDSEGIKFGPSKFFCGRKKNYGVNMQGVCDSNKCFLAVDVRYAGSTSDFFAFEQSDLRKQETQIGFILIIYKEFVNNFNHYHRSLPSQFQFLEGDDPCTPVASLHQS